jgi:hypothetical protein
MSTNPFAGGQQQYVDPMRQQQNPQGGQQGGYPQGQQGGYPNQPQGGQQQDWQQGQGQQGQQGQKGQEKANPIPTPSRTQPIQPIGMTANVDDRTDRLCWAGPSGGSKNDPTQAPSPEQMPDLSSPDKVMDHLKDNPAALWYMSKAEIIAALLGPDIAEKYNAGQRPDAEPDLPTVPKDQHRDSLQGPAKQDEQRGQQQPQSPWQAQPYPGQQQPGQQYPGQQPQQPQPPFV